MARKQGHKLTEVDLRRAAELHYIGRSTWERIAAELDCTVDTLIRWRRRPEWDDVVAQVVASMKRSAPATAWACLERAAGAGDTAAAQQILDRLDGAVAEKHEHTIHDGARERLSSLLAGIAERRGAGGADSGAQ